MIDFLRGTARTVFFLGWTTLLVPPYLILFPLGRWIRRPFVSLWHRGVCFLIALKVNHHGTPVRNQKVLLAGNHLSYLDIPVLASLLDVTFVAKADVANWPLFGFLARIAQTAFIERKPSQARKQKKQLQKRLLAGERLMIFPEGTSSAGKTVLPFKTSLFEMVMEERLKDQCLIQPVTIAPQDNDFFAWYGDMTLMPHLWATFCRRETAVDVIFHAPAFAYEFKDRKSLASWAENRTRSGLENILSSAERDGQTIPDQLDRPEHDLVPAP